MTFFNFFPYGNNSISMVRFDYKFFIDNGLLVVKYYDNIYKKRIPITI